MVRKEQSRKMQKHQEKRMSDKKMMSQAEWGNILFRCRQEIDYMW